MRIGLELLRLIVIVGLLGVLGWGVIENIYTVNEETESYAWLGGLAIFIILFVLYRNTFQFFGWYKGEGRKKLPGKVSIILMSVSVLLIGSPFVLGSLL